MRVVVEDREVGRQPGLFLALNGRTFVEHLLDAVDPRSVSEIVIAALDREKTAGILASVRWPGTITLADSCFAGKDDICLRTDYVYNKRVLGSLIRKKICDPGPAILWKIEGDSDLGKAEELMARAEWNPVGRFINVKLGRSLAQRLASTAVTPNQLTGVSLVCSLLAALGFAAGSYAHTVAAGILVQIHFVVDVADGQLARLKNMRSGYGAWLDALVGRLSDMIWYLAIAWGVYLKTREAVFLVLGTLVIVGNMMIQWTAGMQGQYLKGSPETSFQPADPGLKSLKRVYWFLEQWDVRSYMITIAALAGRLDVVLIYFAVDYNLRWMYNCFKVFSVSGRA